MAKKYYVLDTNILLHSPMAIFGFADNSVCITSTTLQELDSKKTFPGELGYCARKSARIIEELMRMGDVTKGVCLGEAGQFKIIPCDDSTNHLVFGYSLDNPDNQIMNTCLSLQIVVRKPVILVTNDTMLRISAAVNGLMAQEYMNDHVADADYMYTGMRTVEVADDIIASLRANTLKSVYDVAPFENEFYEFKSNGESVPAIYHNKMFRLIKDDMKAGSVVPKNMAQTFALRALMASPEEIPMVVLRGSAGTAKTLLALAAALEAVRPSSGKAKYNQIYITRANQLADEGFGVLPGDLSDKMRELISPFTDNLEVILRANGCKTNEAVQAQIDELFASKIIRLLPLSYIRGRSITKSYIIVDEAQNCSAQLLRDIVTRLGEGSKLVVLGDPSQCDNHELDSHNNGLVYIAEKFHKADSRLCAQLVFDDAMSVRSRLSKEALMVLGD